MRKYFSLGCLLVIVILIGGCSNNKLAENFDENQVKLAGETAIAELSAGNYQEFSDNLVREDLQSALTPKVLENAASQVLGDAGALETFLKEDITGTSDKTTKEAYAVVVIAAQYENKIITYTISFDQSLAIVGFYLK